MVSDYENNKFINQLFPNPVIPQLTLSLISFRKFQLTDMSSEHYIAKHTKEIYKAWSTPGISWKHKFFDILIEIAIIVFTIVLSCFVERWREHLRNKKIEKQSTVNIVHKLFQICIS
jgi:hypothetical protein